MSDKIQQYNAATKQLIDRAETLFSGHQLAGSYSIAETVTRFRDAFRNLDLRGRVITSPLEELRIANQRYSEGFCIISTYSWGHGLGLFGPGRPWQFHQFRNLRTYGTHAWMQNRETGEIFDLTFDQFIDQSGVQMTIPYNCIDATVANPMMPFEPGYIFSDHIGPDFGAMVRQNSLRRD